MRKKPFTNTHYLFRSPTFLPFYFPFQLSLFSNNNFPERWCSDDKKLNEQENMSAVSYFWDRTIVRNWTIVINFTWMSVSLLTKGLFGDDR